MNKTIYTLSETTDNTGMGLPISQETFDYIRQNPDKVFKRMN